MRRVERYSAFLWFCKLCCERPASVSLRLPCPLCGVDVRVDACEECAEKLAKEILRELEVGLP